MPCYLGPQLEVQLVVCSCVRFHHLFVGLKKDHTVSVFWVEVAGVRIHCFSSQKESHLEKEQRVNRIIISDIHCIDPTCSDMRGRGGQSLKLFIVLDPRSAHNAPVLEER